MYDQCQLSLMPVRFSTTNVCYETISSFPLEQATLAIHESNATKEVEPPSPNTILCRRAQERCGAAWAVEVAEDWNDELNGSFTDTICPSLTCWVAPAHYR